MQALTIRRCKINSDADVHTRVGKIHESRQDLLWGHPVRLALFNTFIKWVSYFNDMIFFDLISFETEIKNPLEYT